MSEDLQETIRDLDELRREFAAFKAEAQRINWAGPLTPTIYFELLQEPDDVEPECKTFPTTGSPDAIGWDLYASWKSYGRDGLGNLVPELRIYPNSRVLVGTGLRVEIPKGYYWRIAPRSGLALKSGIDVLAGVIDSDYRGEVGVLLHNTNATNIAIIDLTKPIAQAILERADKPKYMIVNKLNETQRGDKGYGSSDNKKG